MCQTRSYTFSSEKVWPLQKLSHSTEPLTDDLQKKEGTACLEKKGDDNTTHEQVRRLPVTYTWCSIKTGTDNSRTVSLSQAG